MEYNVKKIEPVERTKFDNKSYLRKQLQENTGEEHKENSQQNLKKDHTERTDTQKDEGQRKNSNADVENLKEQMEAISPSKLYRLMNIMNKSPEGAINYLAELSKKNAKSTKPSKQKDDEYSR